MKALFFIGVGLVAWTLLCCWLAAGMWRRYRMDSIEANEITACFWMAGLLVGLLGIALHLVMGGA